MEAQELGQRKHLARALLTAERISPAEREAEEEPLEALRLAAGATPLPTPPLAYGRAEHIPFPEGLAPAPKAAGQDVDPEAPLPQADVLVITWTAAEADALADVLRPAFHGVGGIGIGGASMSTTRK